MGIPLSELATAVVAGTITDILFPAGIRRLRRFLRSERARRFRRRALDIARQIGRRLSALL